MRTTLTLDPDVELLVRRSMAERDLSFKQAVNLALRTALSPAGSIELTFPVYDLGEPAIDLSRARQVADELEDTAIAHELEIGR